MFRVVVGCALFAVASADYCKTDAKGNEGVVAMPFPLSSVQVVDQKTMIEVPPVCLNQIKLQVTVCEVTAPPPAVDVLDLYNAVVRRLGHSDSDPPATAHVTVWCNPPYPLFGE